MGLLRRAQAGIILNSGLSFPESPNTGDKSVPALMRDVYGRLTDDGVDSGNSVFRDSHNVKAVGQLETAGKRSIL